MPLFSELSSKQNMSVLISFKHILQKFFILVGICFWVFLFSYSESIAFTLFWNNFRASWDILKYSSLFLLFNFLLQVNFSIMWWLWKIKQRLAITLIAVVINAIMNILLISYIWVMWAALATWIWWFVMFILSEYTLWKNLSYTPNLISIIKNITIFGLLWYIHIQYILPLINDLGRWVMFLLLLWVCCFWLLIFILINIRDIRIVMLEIKKIRWQI
jgi:O-antigen/teichoic acid export membrane protein